MPGVQGQQTGPPGPPPQGGSSTAPPRPDIIRAPWTPEQVANLNAYQANCRFHPYTCRDRHNLVATPAGWVCVEQGCDYQQTWAHRMSAVESPDIVIGGVVMVYEVTLRVLLAVIDKDKLPEFVKRQIEAARDAHRAFTGKFPEFPPMMEDSCSK